MAIRIDAQELQQLLSLTPTEQNIMLIGRHGIGKSQIITHYYQSQGINVVAFFLGQMSDPGDLIGLMHKEEETGRSVFLPPYWWPDEDQPIVLFLDELNRARPEILQAVQDLTLNKTLAGKQLPAGSMVISAVNEGEEYQLTDLDPALVSRFNLYEFAPTVEDWLLWANHNKVDDRVISFIQKNHHHLDGEEAPNQDNWASAGLVKTPDRRAWVKVSDFVTPHEHIEQLHTKIIAGIVGMPAASAFYQSLAAVSRVTAKQVLENFKKHQKTLAKLSLPELIVLNEQIAFWIEGERYEKGTEDTVRSNFLAYLKALKKQKNQEAIAHMASLVESSKFEKVMGILAESLEIIEFLMEYIDGIAL